MKHQFDFTAICKITLESSQGDITSKHITTDLRLEISENLDQKKYLNEGLPTKDGIKPLTLALIHGLVGNIHMAHENNYWDSAEHLRYIIQELERGFACVAKVTKGEM